MREHRVHQLDLGALERARDRVALDHLRHLGADHVRAEQLAGIGVEHRLHHALGLAHGDRLAVADEGEAADLHLMAGILRALLGEADRGDLRTAIGAAGDVGPVDRVHVVEPGDLLDADHALVARLVREPGRAAEIADGVDAGLAGAADTRRSRHASSRRGILVPSSPRFSTLPTMPTAEITRSTVISCVLPPASIVAVTLSAFFFSPFTAAPVMSFIFCFSNAFLAKALISSSSTGRMRSSTSTTVTSAPMLR